MCSKHIFRLDDIAENMNWENYFFLKRIFKKYNVKPIIGVIPNNKDDELKKYSKSDFNFWDEIREVQNMGWSIALHGYNHKYETKSSGILNINNRSEFAGLPFERQNEKIKLGKKILQENGIKIDAFMAPAHSFDNLTIECLLANGINTVTDGYGLYPYYYRGILFVPQLLSRPRKMPFGVFTWCMHPNTMSKDSIRDIEKFIKNNKGDIITFQEAKEMTQNNILNRLSAKILRKMLILYRSRR